MFLIYSLINCTTQVCCQGSIDSYNRSAKPVRCRGIIIAYSNRIYIILQQYTIVDTRKLIVQYFHWYMYIDIHLTPL